MLVMELHFFERLTVTNPPFVSEQELHFGCCVQEVPLQRRRAIIPVCSWALSIHFVELVVTSRHIPPTSDRFENHAQLAHRDALHGVSPASSHFHSHDRPQNRLPLARPEALHARGARLLRDLSRTHRRACR